MNELARMTVRNDGWLDRMFNDFFHDFTLERPFHVEAFPFGPMLESYRDKEELVIRADLPGVKPEDVKLEADGFRLTISGERRMSTERHARTYYREISYGRFKRVVELPKNANPSAIAAQFTDGVLEIRIKVAPEAVTRVIPIGLTNAELKAAA